MIFIKITTKMTKYDSFANANATKRFRLSCFLFFIIFNSLRPTNTHASSENDTLIFETIAITNCTLHFAKNVSKRPTHTSKVASKAVS